MIFNSLTRSYDLKSLPKHRAMSNATFPSCKKWQEALNHIDRWLSHKNTVSYIASQLFLDITKPFKPLFFLSYQHHWSTRFLWCLDSCFAQRYVKESILPVNQRKFHQIVKKSWFEILKRLGSLLLTLSVTLTSTLYLISSFTVCKAPTWTA